MIKVTILFILLGALAWCLGVRVHPDAFFPANDESFVRVTLNSGETISGDLISQNDQQIEINMEGAIVSFSRNEISNIESVKNTQKKPWITYSPDDALFKSSEPSRNKFVKKSSASKGKSSGGLFDGLDVTRNIQTGLTARNQVEHMKNALNRKTEEKQNIR